MPNPVKPVTFPAGEPESLDELRGDCARMAPQWATPTAAAPVPVPLTRIRGITVPPASARLVDGMSEYGD
ncbi:hypothetical protein AB0I22_37365 [Streptomyces sp. NPDC050610]|uniref:hypothetical protein n=1 Tax=Streptomyces sp. NPDC050610 TaxID=3157097 RepID=UPI0034494612